MTKKEKEKYSPTNEPFEAILGAHKDWTNVIFPENDDSGLDSEWDGLHGMTLDYPGVWLVKLQRMVWAEVLTNQDGTEDCEIMGMYYDFLEKKCIYKECTP